MRPTLKFKITKNKKTMKKIKTVFTVTATFLVFMLHAQVQKDSVKAQQPLALAKAQLPKVQEFGIGISGFNNYSLQYRWGNENRLYRIQGNIGGSGSVGNSSNNSYTAQDTTNNSALSTTKTTTPINLNCGLSFSILKIKPVSEKFGLLYGGFCALNYFIKQSNSTENTNTFYSINNGNSVNHSINTTITKQNSQTFQSSIGLVLGAVYNINASFRIYAEIDPSVYYSYNNSTTNTTSSTTYPNSPNANNIHNTQSSGNGYPTYLANPINTFGLQSLSNSGASLTIVYRITKN
jgi:hypothetical protein